MYSLDQILEANYVKSAEFTRCVQVLRSPNFFLGNGSR